LTASNFNRCPVCNSSSINKFLSRKNVPVHQNLPLNDQKDAIKIHRGDLNLALCEECGFIFNYTFDLSKLEYGNKYDNTQDFSSVFDRYLADLVKYFVFDKNMQNLRIVEVGCGRGTFLRKLVENKEWKNIGYGFDPSYIGPESDLEGRLNFHRNNYDENCARIAADIVICRHVIEHIPEPIKLLLTIKNALNNSSTPRVFFETPDVEWILKNNVIWDFFYEHCSLFTKNSLKTAFEITGFKVENVKNVFEDQYILLEATIDKTKTTKVTKKIENISALAKKFAEFERELLNNWLIKIQKFHSRGKICIWGAGAKGVTFANMIDPDRKLIDCLIDLNPNKQGKFIPGTGHPIVNYKDIKPRKIETAILMNPNYFKENIELLKESKISLDLIK